MKVRNKYRFEDFTIDNYKRILQLAKEKYKFKSFFDFESNNEKSIILRHDVEFSVPIALRMAEIEHSLEIKSTYFIQLHGDFYNTLEKRTLDTFRQIESLGHELALHFDAHFWEIQDEKQLERFLGIDKEVFKTFFGKYPKIFSFHNNNQFTLSCKEPNYSGMINVYSPFYMKEIGYTADSTGFWRYEILEDRLKEAKDKILQILIHDGMWQDEILPPRRRVYKVIDDHAAFMKKSYDETLVKFGAKNIDWEGEV